MVRRSTKTAVPDDFEEHIVDTDVGDEMRASYLEYAYSVIYSRALPDARDGLKPVQRRILYTMNDMGLRPDRGHVKSARVVGEVMGKLHPHGDSAIYDALVRQVQPWSLRLPLIDGHGNFGSPDAGPAAMRYTECRMAPSALAMTANIDEETVDFRANYDGRELEPSVLPAAIPHLVVNGASGIAVGMATNMAPHNLVEVVQALKHLITHPNATIDDLMRFIPGPDLPTGGKIVGLEGVRDAYESGRGSFRMRATARIETIGRRKGIVVTELPYGLGPEKVIERIKTLVQGKKLQGISDIKDLTDLEKGLRLVIEVKNGFVPEALLEQLYRLTPMEDSFGINNVALVEGQPRTLGLKEMLTVFLEHRFDVVRRRSTFRRKKAADRLHLVEGLLLAILDIDEVIQLIRASDNSEEARGRLMSVFDLTETQANYILDMQLRRLTKFSKIELDKEKSELEREIEALDAILGDDKLLRKVVADELGDVAKTFGTPRRTVLLESAGTGAVTAATAPLEVADDPCYALMSASGLLARTASAEPVGAGGGRTNHDVVVSAVATTARGEVGVITSAGRVLRLGVLDLPAIPPSANDPNLQGGLPLSEMLPLDSDEKALALCSLATSGPGLALGTRQGVVKRVNPEVLAKDEWDVIALKDDDEVVGAVELTTGDETLCFITSDAQLLHFGAGGVRPQGRSGGGIAGIKLAAGQQLVSFGALDPGAAVVVTVSGSSTALPGTEPGAVKVTPFSEYPAKGRATGGVRCHRFLKGEDTLVFAWAGLAPARASAASGSPVDLPEATGRRDGSGVPGSQPIVACAGPLAVRLGNPFPRVWKADRMRLPHRLAAGVAVGVLGLAGLTACSDDGSGGVTDNKSADADDDGDVSAQEVLALARTTFDETSGVNLSLTTKDLPDGVDGLVSAEGVATHAPAFEGTATVSLSGSPFNVDPLVAVDGKVYASIPGIPITQEIDPAEYGAPDPAQLMDTENGFSSILTETKDLEEGDTVRGGDDNSEILTEYTGTVAGSVVENIIPSAEGDFDVTYTVAENGELREAQLTGVFYSDSDEMTYTVGITDYGTEKDITEP